MAAVVQSSPSRVPILLLTGFLGSGKTSLLNRLMASRPVSRGKIAIVVNEFGDVGIDGSLLPSDMTRQVELPGGCVCCVLNEDLDKTLTELLDTSPDVEMIIIETTGVAEPLPISWALEAEPLAARVRLAAVITVVDATHFESARSLSSSVDPQVEHADILVLSKTDLLDAGVAPDDLVDTLRELNPPAPLVSGTPDEVVQVLWRSIADPALPSAFAARQARRGTRPTPHDHHGDGHDHGSADDREREHGQVRPLTAGHGFETVWLPIQETIDFEELSTNLEDLPGNYVRIKGVAHVIDESTGSAEPHWVAFHRVGTRVSSEPLMSPVAGRVVAIGPGVERARLAACFEAAVVPSDGR